ncbi:MAG TPA: 3-hydroxyacyl-CoA dehydrogenase NAD-binding domain-containing protein [Chitinophagaceae bacterium]|jgi:3-hydroxybutyryl-CoA dehydrogenase
MVLKLENIKTICVCGAGTMGSGIAQIAVRSGYNTIQFDVNEAMLEKSKANITTALQKLVEKNKLSEEEKNATLNRLSFTDAIENCQADIIIEAIIENKEAKIELFNKVAEINNADTIFATNTSSISVEEISAATSAVSKVAGMHFFNPAPVMKLVEIVVTTHTEKQVIEILTELAKQFGKIPVVCKDVPGFIVNRVARQYYLEALLLLMMGLTDIETIDAVMEATGFKMGPFKLMDLIGMDVNYSVSNIVWEALGKPERLKPSAIQKEKINKAELGRKTGKGFYIY